MSGPPQLQTIFQELDYLDDGYNDGLVSHVGLRRIILETPELEAEVGPTFTRALLTRAESNLYGRMTFDEFILLAREVQSYSTAGRRGGHVASSNQNGNQVHPEYSGTVQYPKSAPKHTLHNAAVKLAIPVNERDDRLNYLDKYSCKPPPMFILLLSLLQISVFVWHVILLNNRGETVGKSQNIFFSNLLATQNFYSIKTTYGLTNMCINFFFEFMKYILFNTQLQTMKKTFCKKKQLFRLS